MVTVGATVYPAPAFVRRIFSSDVTPPFVVKTPTAVALSPTCPVGDDVIPMVGVEVYPEPSWFKKIFLTYPLPKVP